jgi:4a-hydroxytetrahydrobiopterin dehydratase
MADMSDDADIVDRSEASAAVTGLGWRYLLGTLVTAVRAGTPARAVQAAALAVDIAGAQACQHLRADLRGDQLILTVQSLAATAVTRADIDLARRITAALSGTGLATSPEPAPDQRPVQQLEIAIDALDIPSVRPFWQAVLGYQAEPGDTSEDGALADPARQGPAVWFQQMDIPRPQRNRIHIDVTVGHDEAARRIEAAIAAGGRLVSDAEAPAFWLLADPEGNEACVCTWQGRDS